MYLVEPVDPERGDPLSMIRQYFAGEAILGDLLIEPDRVYQRLAPCVE